MKTKTHIPAVHNT